MIEIFTAPGCQRCVLTAKQFEKAGIAYTLTDISENPALQESVIARAGGQRELPIVDTGETVWSGFKPDLIREAIAKAA